MLNMKLFVMIAAAVFYYRLGRMEYGSGWVTLSFSVLLSVLAAYAGASFIVVLLLQIALFLGLIAWNWFSGHNPHF